MIDGGDIFTGAIEGRHLEPNLYAIKFGLAINRPAVPGIDGWDRVYFETDTNKLYIYNGSWLSVTLS